MAMPITVPRYTVDMLDRLPDDGNRYELLDGMLLVTPAPSRWHQVVVSRLSAQLVAAVQVPGLADVVSPGVIEVRPGLRLEPDILVYPSSYSLRLGWDAIGDRWLAVEVLSPSTRIYDQDFKLGAYLALGVRDVWLVDAPSHTVAVYQAGGVQGTTVRNRLEWRAPAGGGPYLIDLDAVFAGVLA